MLLAALFLASAVPATNPGSWITSDDYPTAERRNEVEGSVGFELSIWPDGNPRSCKVVEGSGSAVLDNITCTLLMQRAKFNPYRAGSSKEALTYRSRVSWQIPATTKYPVALSGVSATMHFANGVAKGECIEAAMGAYLEDFGPCEFFDLPERPDWFPIKSFAGYETIQIRFFLHPADMIEPAPLGIGPDVVQNKLLSADFQVLPMGDAGNCAVTEALIPDEETAGFCFILEDEGRFFEADIARTEPVPMKLVIDVLSQTAK